MILASYKARGLTSRLVVKGCFQTNDHNFLYENKRLTPDRLAVQLWDNPQYFRLHNTATMFPYPLDCAFTLIDRKWAADKALQPNQAKSLLGGPVLPEDIGQMVASLLSDANHRVNGQRIDVSGGMRLWTDRGTEAYINSRSV
jgi:hypothetical protein